MDNALTLPLLSTIQAFFVDRREAARHRNANVVLFSKMLHKILSLQSMANNH